MDCFRPSSVVSLNEDASRILEDSFFILVSLLCFHLPSKFSSNVVEIRAWNSKSNGQVDEFLPTFTRETNSRFRKPCLPFSSSFPPFSLLPSFVFKRDLSSLAPCKSCSARKFLLLQLNSRTLVIYVNKNTVPFRGGGGDAVEYFILVVGRVGGGGEEGERIVVSTTILENSCGRRNWSTRFTLDPLP